VLTERPVLTVQLLEAQDEERRRLAKELHDTTAQQISAAIMDLDVIAKEAQALSPKACTALSECATLVRQTLEDMRTFSYLLHPPMLDEFGSISAIRAFCEGFSQRSGIRVESELADGIPRMPKGWERALFHVVQEGLMNVRRHSKSSMAKVCIYVSADQAIAKVENEGSGLPALTAGGLDPAKMGVGIGGMRERLAMFGGHVSLYSHANRTILEATLPLARAAASM
jgi:signal transduction histidine kinase